MSDQMVEEDCKLKNKTVPFQKTGYFSKTICDYLDKNEKITPFYNNFPDLTGFKKQIDTKRMSFRQSGATRNLLVSSISDQYKKTNTSKKTKQNIQSLLKENTFTVTTGHQLNLFTGPLYFLYKIVSTINLAKRLKSEFPNDNFVPVYWMATEDHDFEEINYFNFKGKKISWNRESSGGVGRLSTKGLDVVLKILEKELGTSTNATHLAKLFKEAYLEHNNLTYATRYLANELFGEYGLVIIDGDDKSLKQQFAPFVKDELENQTSFKAVSRTVKSLEKNYKVQVNPREINLFYLTDELRERIVLEDGVYKVNNTNISWSKLEVLKELSEFPEKFSPNVIMRPLYQEVILPNLCYIGGGGELAYWFELKNYFETIKVPFPILLLRNSAVIVSEKQTQKLEKLNISLEEIFLKQQDLINKKIKEISKIKIDLSQQRTFLEKQFADLEVLANQTDKSFIGAVKAQQKKQLNGLDNLEKRLLKAEKRKHHEITDRIKDIQDQLFPNQSLEERQRNFSELYLEYGDDLIKKLISCLDPLQGEFQIIEL
ncbi:MAG: bacillithiol biosynthesis cysteine-adding enzyme BshC [Flavobacteriaceae bacterium]|nr:bacillithiol biosynthesis cysteine-adding enzyme BshC [Flavobacteriaceae bacterium]